ncbi:hypothetical protein Mapa_013232 [Marchantia paleacea]|nr:hypothetical protein Mapa_013232 [Marchantia paleacea]
MRWQTSGTFIAKTIQVTGKFHMQSLSQRMGQNGGGFSHLVRFLTTRHRTAKLSSFHTRTLKQSYRQVPGFGSRYKVWLYYGRLQLLQRKL